MHRGGSWAVHPHRAPLHGGGTRRDNSNKEKNSYIVIRKMKCEGLFIKRIIRKLC